MLRTWKYFCLWFFSLSFCLKSSFLVKVDEKKRNRDVKVIIQMVNTDETDHCTKDALTSFLGYMLQAVLAGLAFTCLIGTSTLSLFDNIFFASTLISLIWLKCHVVYASERLKIITKNTYYHFSNCHFIFVIIFFRCYCFFFKK